MLGGFLFGEMRGFQVQDDSDDDLHESDEVDSDAGGLEIFESLATKTRIFGTAIENQPRKPTSPIVLPFKPSFPCPRFPTNPDPVGRS